ncbi:hypothetical protein [Actinoplanes sp. CA-252034]|uniref:hypothetical protein n=1 Tax=Actinoplanes sp. CA-252034 TaxID=3239906 RepID=UPI003D95924E
MRELTGGGPSRAGSGRGTACLDQAVGIIRGRGVTSRGGAHRYEQASVSFAGLFGGDLTLDGGLAPVGACIAGLLPNVVDGAVALTMSPRSTRVMGGREVLEALHRVLTRGLRGSHR